MSVKRVISRQPAVTQSRAPSPNGRQHFNFLIFWWMKPFFFSAAQGDSDLACGLLREVDGATGHRPNSWHYGAVFLACLKAGDEDGALSVQSEWREMQVCPMIGEVFAGGLSNHIVVEIHSILVCRQVGLVPASNLTILRKCFAFPRCAVQCTVCPTAMGEGFIFAVHVEACGSTRAEGQARAYAGAVLLFSSLMCRCACSSR